MGKISQNLSSAAEVSGEGKSLMRQSQQKLSDFLVCWNA